MSIVILEVPTARELLYKCKRKLWRSQAGNWALTIWLVIMCIMYFKDATPLNEFEYIPVTGYMYLLSDGMDICYINGQQVTVDEFQIALEVDVDGKVGTKTLNAAREAYYESIISLE